MGPTTTSNSRRAGPDAPKPRKRGVAGFTLIEIMIVVVLMALVMTGVGVGLGAVMSARVKEGATRLMAASRYAYHRATTQGTTVRLRINLDKGTFVLEESEGDVPVPQPPSKDRPGQGRWQDAEAALEAGVELEVPPPLFGPLLGANDKPIKRFEAKPIGDGVQVDAVYLPDQEAPVGSGVADLFFLPGGYAQGGVIFLSRKGENKLTVSVSPLIAKTAVQSGHELPAWLDDPDAGNVEDPNR